MLWRPPYAGPARGACAACVMQMTYCLSGNSYRAEGRLLRAVHGQKLPGIGGHAPGDGQSWWQQEEGLLVSCAHGGKVCH